jgi:integrase
LIGAGRKCLPYGRTGAINPKRTWAIGIFCSAARQAVDEYLKAANKKPGEFLFAGRRGPQKSITTRQYARLVSDWIGSVGLDPRLYGTHSQRRTKATLIYRRTGNLRAVQLLLGHTKVEHTVRYLGIEVDDALAIAEQVDV